ncbi:MAG: MATE family efflux transporter [Oceanospirillaceae bacterium]|nr:MATE family efflux transporter [Oceanospirillaceae bacterium]
MTAKNRSTPASAKFLTGSLMGHVSVMSFTSSIGLLMIFAVDFVDLLFISMLGEEALAAAVGYAGIILFFANSISIGLSIAAGSLVAKSLGANNGDQAKSYASAVLAIGVIFSLFTLLSIYLGLNQLLRFLGASGETRDLALSYLQIILPTMPFAAVAFIGMAILRAHGDAKRAMYCTVAAGLVNAVLDPIFIFSLDFGLAGAASASAIARLTMFGMVLWPIFTQLDALAPLSWSLLKRNAYNVFSIMVPAILTNIATPVGAAIVTREMAVYGTLAVAGMAIIGRMSPVVFSVIFALSGAIGPIIGQNYGAGLMPRVKAALVAGLKFIFIYVLMVSVLLFFARDTIVALFDAKDASAELVMLFCGVLSFAYFFNGVIFVTNAFFNNTGYPLYSTAVNWGRHTLGTLPLVLIGSHYWGAPGILIGQAIGGVIFAIIALSLCLSIFNKEQRRRCEIEINQQLKQQKILLNRQ